MFIAITGTPGIGKSSVSKILEKKGYELLDINNIAINNNFILEYDKNRDSNIIDLEKIDEFIFKNYNDKGLIFIDSHLSHLLKCVDKIILLRCHPNVLKKILLSKGWKDIKIKENVEAEILDIILCESIENHDEKNIFEIDTTKLSVIEVYDKIDFIIKNDFKDIKNYKLGKIDWSEEFMKDD